jgi:putative multiple sugar transport system ATP-binding protein
MEYKMSETILDMKGIIKVFPGVRALDGVSFTVKKGEIHCLVGENGAGKSTLMKVLSGVHPYGSYEGQILLENREQRFYGIADSEKAGIAIINQELALIPDLTVYENIFFGHEIVERGFINWNKTIIGAQEILKRIGLSINPAVKARMLGVGQQQMVEIAKALSKNVKLLILDEPTAALNEDDCSNLLNLLRDFKKQGITSIMISHKLKEVLAIADTITVLRDGETICSMDIIGNKVTENTIIKNMVGREIDTIYPGRSSGCITDDVIFEAKNWNAFKGEKQILKDVNIKLRRGEIVGMAGLMGAGRTEFALSVFGNTPNYKLSGELYMNGEKTDLPYPGKAIEKGIAYVTEDRKSKGLVLIQDIKYNITFANLNGILRNGILDLNKEIKIANEYKQNLSIKTPSVEQKIFTLSGGNQQKVSVAKWLYAEPNVLILDEPTRGIDVGAKYEIYTFMNKMVEQGMSILMISSELLEILGMSDRIYVMAEGRITGEFLAGEATEQKIMEIATDFKEATL